jgi:hypothetical protein
MMNNQNPTGIQIGAVTHHHDHVMTPISLRTRKMMNRIVPRPSDELDEFAAISLFV